ncbi:MAG: HAD-IA family hydrolase [Pseudomonadota bacterium]
MTLKLVIFDFDGTLVDSQGTIVACMAQAFDAHGLEPPARSDILSIVGLSLPQAMAVLAPDADRDGLVQAYKNAFASKRLSLGAADQSPLYPGARAAIERLHDQPDTLLGIATGKSKRGLDALLEAHGLARYFVTCQVADHHPSKPHPSMVMTALVEAGVAARDAVMLGDTTFDMQMAQGAGVPFVGVGWGYHSPDQMHGAHAVIRDFDALDAALHAIWEPEP